MDRGPKEYGFVKSHLSDGHLKIEGRRSGQSPALRGADKEWLELTARSH
jgi:hypothetical protein